MARKTKAKVVDNTDLEKDLDTGIVTNTNTNEYLAFIRQREAAQSKDEKIASLETQVSELKDMVAALIEKINNG